MTTQKNFHPAIKPYTLANGTVLYRFTAYLGVDQNTGKDKIVTRSKFPSAKHAQAALDKLKYEFTSGHAPEDLRKSFSDVYAEWDILYKDSGIVMSTYSKTEGYFNNHILPFFKNMKVSKITVRHCEQFALQLSKKLKYFQHIINYASDVLETAVRYGYINSNPFAIAKIPKEQVHEKSENYLDGVDLGILIKYVETLDLKIYALLRLLIFTGMRKGELIVLTWSDIDFAKKSLSIHEAYSFSKYNKGKNVGRPKGKLSRIITLDDRTLGILEQWQQEQLLRLAQIGILADSAENQLIFSNSVNNYLKQDYPNQIIRPILSKLNLKYITVHGLRHTHATLLTEAGASLIGIQQRLGHSEKKNTTNGYYVHVTEIIKQKTLNSLLDYFKTRNIF
ncbi:tyrosine-type recombinase/integrase [Viridibacillus arvi]|uniref:tyrosine-type recombinase/integrase n=1 Tax=Viridibacillus arvi TaxID=263475 RepID=UPI003D065962